MGGELHVQVERTNVPRVHQPAEHRKDELAEAHVRRLTVSGQDRERQQRRDRVQLGIHMVRERELFRGQQRRSETAANDDHCGGGGVESLTREQQE